MQPVSHTAAIDVEAALLSATVVATLLSPDPEFIRVDQFLLRLEQYFRGKGGAKPTKSSLKEAGRLRAYLENPTSKPSKNSVIAKLLQAYQRVQSVRRSGSPVKDWEAVVSAIGSSGCNQLGPLLDDVRTFGPLGRRPRLRESLASDWRESRYQNAESVFQDSLLREHFSTTSSPEKGVVLMTMHKAKGKQFDEVIVFENWPMKKQGRILGNYGRFVRENSRAYADDQSRQNLRVSVTRGKARVTIMTPKGDPSVLLLP